MRLISLWALKHLVLHAPNDIKMTCLEELGTGWLMQTVTGEPRDTLASVRGPSQVSTPIGMGTPNAAGEQVDLLNAVEEPLMDIDEATDGTEGEDEDAMTDSIGSLRLPRYTQATAFSQHKARLKAIKNAEQNPVVRSQKDDIVIQEQALDYIRNLISEPSSAGAPEMIDHLFNICGAERLFQVLASKLKPKAATATPSKPVRTVSLASAMPPHFQPSPSSRPLPDLHLQQPDELIVSTLFILVHIANGTPRHRSLLLHAHPDLPRAVEPLFVHPNPRVRIACIWLVNNLTWMDDQSDAVPARQRALELRAVGIEDAVRRCVADLDLDVRERAKTAVEQMAKLLDGLAGAQGAGPAGGAVARGWER